jgi:hypothetical protein
LVTVVPIDPICRRLKGFALGPIERVDGGSQGVGAQFECGRVTEIKPIKTSRVLQQSHITTPAHVSQNRGDGLLDRGVGRWLKRKPCGQLGVEIRRPGVKSQDHALTS